MFNKIILTLIMVFTLSVTTVAEAKRSTNQPKVSDRQAFNAVKRHIYEAEKKTGLRSGVITSILSIESNMGRNTYNPKSNVRGAMQYKASTWRSDLNKHHRQLGLSKNASVKDPRASILVASAAILDNKNYLEKKTGKRITDGDLYMSQLVGLYGAEKILKGKSNESIAKYIRITAGNQRLMTNKGKPLTVKQFRAKLNQEVKSHERRYAVSLNKSETFLAKN